MCTPSAAGFSLAVCFYKYQFLCGTLSFLLFISEAPDVLHSSNYLSYRELKVCFSQNKEKISPVMQWIGEISRKKQQSWVQPSVFFCSKQCGAANQAAPSGTALLGFHIKDHSSCSTILQLNSSQCSPVPSTSLPFSYPSPSLPLTWGCD